MQFNVDYRICFPKEKVFISRDHNWAFAAWEIGKIRNYIKPGSTLVHIDAHLDFCNPNTHKKIINEQETINFASNIGIEEIIIPDIKNGTMRKIYMLSDYKK